MQTTKHILFTGRYQSIDTFLIKQWANFAVNYNARIHFIFQTEGNGFPETFEETYFRLFEDGTPDYSFEMTFFPGSSISNGINEYVREKDISLIVLEDLRDHKFVEALFGSDPINILKNKPGVPVISLKAVPQEQITASVDK